jgi:mannosyltransferase OCH1-like enzyme
MNIPRILHRVWLGNKPMPEEHQKFGEKWLAMHSGWEMKLWSDEFIETSRFRKLIETARKVSSRSNIIRLEVIERYGGVYCDTDVEPLRCFETLLEDVEAFCGYEVPDQRVCNAVFGATPYHPWLATLLATLPAYAGCEPPWGPIHMTASLDLHPEVTTFDQGVLYPLLWDKSKEEIAAFQCPSQCYAKHYWAHGW